MKRTRRFPFSSRRIVAVAAGPGLTVAVTWEDGGRSRIDLAPWIQSGARNGRLLKPQYFAQASVGEDGWTVAWGGEEIEIDSVHLQLLEAEQRGLIFSPDAMRRWRARYRFTLESAAKALGLSRRMMAYYERGEKPIPRHVALACKGYEALEGVRPAA